MRRSAIAALLVSTISIASAEYADAAFTLPDPLTNALAYGDFYSYSLPILAYKYDLVNGGGTGPGNPFYVASDPGAIKDTVVVATGASGGPLNTNYAGMNNPYATPSGHSGTFQFSTGTYAHPGSVSPPVLDPAGTWNTDISAMKSFLGSGNELVIFFNNNQTKSGSAADETLFAWGQISVIDKEGVLPTLRFDFTNNAGLGPLPAPSVFAYNSPGAPIGPWPSPWPQDYVLSGGKVCTNATGTSIVACGSPGAVSFDHNLGANQAAYAITSPELNALLWGNDSADYDILAFDIRMNALNNGYEQIFISSSPSNYNVPEPSTLLLSAAGLGVAVLLRRKIRKA